MATEHLWFTQINVGRQLGPVAFSANGKYLVSGDDIGVRVWQMEVQRVVASMEALFVLCLAVSMDESWIAAGTGSGNVFMWNATTYKKVFKLRQRGDFLRAITAVDFSSDSSCLVSSCGRDVTVWDVSQGIPVQTFSLDSEVKAAKYSPDGGRIATATKESVQVWNNDGRLLVRIPVQVTGLSFNNRALLWGVDNHLFVISSSTIKEFDASSGLVVSEWHHSNENPRSCIAMPRHRGFAAYSAGHTVTFWDTSTRTQLYLLEQSQEISSVALSLDGQFLAIGGSNGKIIIRQLPTKVPWQPSNSHMTPFHHPSPRHFRDCLPSPHSTAPFMHITDTALEAWKHDRLTDTESSLTLSISDPLNQNQKHYALANRALVRSHLQNWSLAIDDAENSIRTRPSVIGYIALSVALIGKGQKEDGCRVFDLAFRHCNPSDVDDLLLIKAVVLSMAGKHNEAVSRVGDLIAKGHSNETQYIVQAYMYYLLGITHLESSDYVGAIHLFERAQVQTQSPVRFHLFAISLISGWKFGDLRISIRRSLCEARYAAGRIEDAANCLLELVNTSNKQVYTDRPLTEWVSDFTRRCLSKKIPYTNSFVLDSTIHSQMYMNLLSEWTKSTLASSLWKDALVTAAGFAVPAFALYRVVCEHLETVNCITDASECFRQMLDGLSEQEILHQELAEWVSDFKSRCTGKLETRGDTALSAEQHVDAISHYSAALALDPTIPQRLFTKRSKAYVAIGSWEAAMNDAHKVIELDPLSPWGYERKHAVLHKAGDYENAIHATETMLSKLAQSSDPGIRELRHQYVSPGEARAAIRGAVQHAIRDSPRVLIDTMSGRLLDKSAQASAFESLPLFNKLISSMTTNISHDQIKHDVAQYYQYAMFSHKWEDDEPLFDKVIDTVVYDLEETPTNNKLRMFCRIVRDAGLYWAWSDTCCINKADHFVLQEALVSMFKWYQGSSLTLVLLLGVRSPSRRGDLVKSIWNSRAWTFQEYHASRVVRFYNEDWTLYLDLDIHNHKESPEILSEMEEATGVSTRALVALQPGLDDIRQKLCLASARQTTLVEDAAYSLLGIFSISLPVVYGEGDQALGRLLSQLLTNSGDSSILAWTGKSGGFNSCLPAELIVFHQLSPPHIPLAVTSIEMEKFATLLNPSSVTMLYDRLKDLPIPLFVGKRMKLPCIVFKLGPLSTSRSRSERVFRAQTGALGIVEIKTEEDLLLFNSLYLVHPWIDFLLDQQPVGSVPGTIPGENADDESSTIGDFPLFPGPSEATLATPQARTVRVASRFTLSFGGLTSTRRRHAVYFESPPDTSLPEHTSYTESLQPPSTLKQSDKQIRSLQAVARLRQPFGALLLTPTPGKVAAYRRVATESLIMVRIEEITSVILDKLIDSVRVLDVL